MFQSSGRSFDAQVAFAATMRIPPLWMFTHE
jgi:hypothetical protein